MNHRPDRTRFLGRTALPLLVLFSCAMPAMSEENGASNGFDAGALLDTFRRTPVATPEAPATVAAPAGIAPAPFVAATVEKGRMLPLSEQLQPYRKGRFLDERHKIAPRLPVLGGDAITYFHVVATQDLANLYLTHGLWAEAGSISRSGHALLARLRGASPETDRELQLLQAEFDRVDALVLLMDPRLTQRRFEAKPILDAYAKTWPDAALFTTILSVETGDIPAAGPQLDIAAQLLESFPPSWRAQILPILLEGAVASGSEKLADRLMVDLSALAARTPAGILPYLQGMQFERLGKAQDAMDAYAKASAHDDMFAQRSRIARIKLGLTQGLIDIEQARSELAIARNSWHGDDLALSALRLAIDIERDTGHPLEALLAIEEIRLRYPEAEGLVSEEEKWALIEAFYTPSDGVPRPFADLLAGHRRISELYGSEFGFFKYAESMGDQLRSFGALRLAGEEYSRVLDALESDEAGFGEDPEARLVFSEIHDRLRLKRAETLLAIGEAETARDLLTPGPKDGRDATRVDRLIVLRAQAEFDSGDYALVDDHVPSKPMPDYLRIAASAQAALGEWEKARETWKDLAAIEGLRPTRQDIDSLTLASEKAGKILEDKALIATLSEKIAHPEPAAYAEIFSDKVGEIDPLTKDTLTEHMDRADRTLQIAKGDQP